jgi:hemerythrin-like metal-binding protein
MSLFQWDDVYSVGFDEIDHQHVKLFDIANEYHNGFSQHAGGRVLLPIFGQLVDYTKRHFADEERIMERCAYPDLGRHRQNHQRLIANVLNYKRQFDEGVVGVEAACMDFLKMWLNAHILGTDKQYAPYLNGQHPS